MGRSLNVRERVYLRTDASPPFFVAYTGLGVHFRGRVFGSRLSNGMKRNSCFREGSGTGWMFPLELLRREDASFSSRLTRFVGLSPSLTVRSITRHDSHLYGLEPCRHFKILTLVWAARTLRPAAALLGSKNEDIFTGHLYLAYCPKNVSYSRARVLDNSQKAVCTKICNSLRNHP